MKPLKAIRKQCLWCCNNQPKEVRLCPKTDCPLYPLRFDKKNDAKNSAIETIRKYCLGCGEGTAQAVNNCEFPECDLYIFRNGKNPNCQRPGFTPKEPFFKKD